MEVSNTRTTLIEYKELLENQIVSDEWADMHDYDKGWIRGRSILIDDILDGRFFDIDIEVEDDE